MPPRRPLGPGPGPSGSPVAPPKKLLLPKGRTSSKPKKGESELDQLMKMGPTEFYPYACLLLLILFTILYNIAPSIFKYFVEFQYPLAKEEKDEDPNVVLPPKVEFFHVGPLDILHLVYVYLGVVGFQIFIAELLQAVAKYILRTAKKTQETFVSQATYLIFHVVTIASGFGLVSSKIFSDPHSIWVIDEPITRTLKFYLLIQIAFQISFLVQYLIHTPNSSWKLTNIIGNSYGILLTLAGYFAGYSIPLLLISLCFDISSVIYEFWIMVKAFPPKQFVHIVPNLRQLLTLSWILNRIVIPLVFILHYIALVVVFPKSSTKESEVPEASAFPLLQLILLVGLAGLSGIQVLWFTQINEKYAKLK